MADIELVIKIPEGLKKDFELEQWTALSCMEMKNALIKGTPLPKGHGDLIDRNELMSTRIITDDYSGNEIMDVVLAEDIDYAPTIIPAERSDTD